MKQQKSFLVRSFFLALALAIFWAPVAEAGSSASAYDRVTWMELNEKRRTRDQSCDVAFVTSQERFKTSSGQTFCINRIASFR